MRYIRTKEGKIIDIDKRYEWHLKNGWVNKKIKDKETFIKTSHYNIVKQSDTIEELCDEFVMLCLHDENGNKTRPIIMNNLSLLIGYMDANYGYAIYGAIWTGNGLIYVAKMNEKGELELL